jgi:hypothetical protein
LEAHTGFTFAGFHPRHGFEILEANSNQNIANQIMKTYQVQWIIASLAVTGLNAQGTGPSGSQPPPPLLLPVLDKNKDGALSADEISAASEALLSLDKNNDGKLGRKELMPPPPKPPKDGSKPTGPPPPPPGPPIILKALDLDKNGELSASEIEDAPLSLKILDKNDDGTISKAELKPGPPPAKDPT